MAVAKDKGGEPGKEDAPGPVKGEGKGQQMIRNPDADPIGQHWPRQSLFVGQNYSVEWNGGGGKFAAHQEAVNLSLEMIAGLPSCKSNDGLKVVRRHKYIE